MGYQSEVGAIISVDRTEHKEIGTYVNISGETVPQYSLTHSDKDKAKFRELVGKMKLIMGEHLTDSFDDEISWYDYKIVLYVPSCKWYSDYNDVKAWNKFWEVAQTIEGVSGVFRRTGEEIGDIEELNFGDDPCYEDCYVVQSVVMQVATTVRETLED